MVHVGCLHPAYLSSDDRGLMATQKHLPGGTGASSPQLLIELLMLGPTNHISPIGTAGFEPATPLNPITGSRAPLGYNLPPRARETRPDAGRAASPRRHFAAELRRPTL